MTSFSYSRFLLIIGLVQFINILDFIMVMPLGPDFAKALGIPLHHLGYVGGSYTMAATLSGLAGAVFLDWYDRKRMILVTLAGLAVATLLPCFATDMTTMLAARILAGLFGGPLTASALAMIADVVPVERRGDAMGKVMGAFSLAMVFGVPFGLELARQGSWRMPFVVLALVALVVLVLAYKWLPENANQRAEKSLKMQVRHLGAAFRNPIAWNSWGINVCATIGAFLIIPNIVAHVQFNMGFPRDQLSLLYLAGGSVSFFSMRIVGAWVDKSNTTIVSLVGTAVFVLVLYFGFIDYRNFSAYVMYIGFMVANTARNVAGQALASKVPLPRERASFMSIQTTVVHASCSIGAFLGSVILVQGTQGRLLHEDYLGWVAIAVSLLVPPLFFNTERLLNKRHRQVTPDPVAAGFSDIPPA